MNISYKWLSEYLPVKIEPERLSRILTSIGLEVENLEKFEEVKNSLHGLIIGEVMDVQKHPNADKLSLTKVNIGNGEPLSIVCGAPNVAVGQKVIVAGIGTTIYPGNGDPLTMKLAKIRGEESHGMICAEDEIGLGNSHAGILVLPNDVIIGNTAVDYFQPYEDWVFEIGLTPNRMDAMSHWGIARDVCAYLSHHDKKEIKPIYPVTNNFKPDSKTLTLQVEIENTNACQRYSGISISNITVAESPKWLQQKLKSIGIRPINNIVDITNFIQHETGQPLHAFDADAITGNKVIVKNLAEGTSFITLDEKQRKLHADDLMICNTEAPMCIAGVFGGLESGVSENTKNIFLESAWFNPIDIRKTSFRHGLRTDAASRFEKGIDISGTVSILKRAALLIKEICAGEISSDIIDIYPDPKEKTQVILKHHYLKKLSGKNYHQDSVKNILQNLGFEITRDGQDEIMVLVPYHKPDISLPADIVEEILRIDGLDNIEIPESIHITPSSEINAKQNALKEKLANYLVGSGFNEIVTNSITNSAYYSEEELKSSVSLLNNLSTELNILRPSMIETGLEVLSYNINRKNNNCRLFEFGSTYERVDNTTYTENSLISLYLTGAAHEAGWRTKETIQDIYLLKGFVNNILTLYGLTANFESLSNEKFETGLFCKVNGKEVGQIGIVSSKKISMFDIKQPVLFANLNLDSMLVLCKDNKIIFNEIPKFPVVHRDLAIVVSKDLTFDKIEKAVHKNKLDKLQNLSLFDIFESEKLGIDKKSMAVNFTFQDSEKTLTDIEIDGWMNTIMVSLEKELNAEIRK